MLLCEEYFKRKNLQVSFVKHVNKTSLFIKTGVKPEDACNMVYTIDWEPGDIHPGRYKLRTWAPIHNGFSVNGRAFSLLNEKEIEWDEYESHIKSWIGKINRTIVVKDYKEMWLLAWEMFVYVCDQEISVLSSHTTFFNSLDVELPTDERYLAFRECLGYLHQKYPNLYSFWISSFNHHCQQYAHWLANLVNPDA